MQYVSREGGPQETPKVFYTALSAAVMVPSCYPAACATREPLQSPRSRKRTPRLLNPSMCAVAWLRHRCPTSCILNFFLFQFWEVSNQNLHTRY